MYHTARVKKTKCGLSLQQKTIIEKGSNASKDWVAQLYVTCNWIHMHALTSGCAWPLLLNHAYTLSRRCLSIVQVDSLIHSTMHCGIMRLLGTHLRNHHHACMHRSRPHWDYNSVAHSSNKCMGNCIARRPHWIPHWLVHEFHAPMMTIICTHCRPDNTLYILRHMHNHMHMNNGLSCVNYYIYKRLFEYVVWSEQSHMHWPCIVSSHQYTLWMSLYI